MTTTSIPLYKYSQHLARWKIILSKETIALQNAIRIEPIVTPAAEKAVCICVQIGADFKPFVDKRRCIYALISCSTRNG